MNFLLDSTKEMFTKKSITRKELVKKLNQEFSESNIFQRSLSLLSGLSSHIFKTMTKKIDPK